MSISVFDINADVGEGIGNDALLIPYIHEANIACGYHAGDIQTMNDTIELCIKHGVKIGAHPSYQDKENFGRTEMQLEEEELYDLIIQQLLILSEIASVNGQSLNHVKPHGALYNQSAKDPAIAKTISRAVKDFNEQLILFGLSGSHSITEAEKLGLKTANEVFADRTYQDDGSLTPRSRPGALIEERDIVVLQADQMINEGMVTTVSGKKIPVKADTICIHGDGKHAVEFAKAIWDQLR